MLIECCFDIEEEEKEEDEEEEDEEEEKEEEEVYLILRLPNIATTLGRRFNDFILFMYIFFIKLKKPLNFHIKKGNTYKICTVVSW